MPNGKKIIHSIVDGIEGKPCSVCETWKPLSSFHKNTRVWDGYNYNCSACRSGYDRARTEKNKAYRENNKERFKPGQREYYRNNYHKVRLRAKNWRINNKERYLKYFRDRRLKDVSFRLSSNMSHRITKVLRGVSKSKNTESLIGCSIEELKEHLASMFSPEMNWDNYGSYWHVDHIIPCASFDLTIPEEQTRCFHFTNLQPMEATANIKKNSRMPNGKYIRKKWNYSQPTYQT